MFAGPLVSREALTAPRQLKHFLIRSGYVGGLFVLLYTAVQATFGLQQVSRLGELARFGALMFQMISLVQMTLIIFFAVLFAAGRVAQEKDRRTLLLLLMTDLKSIELVGGKLGASLLLVSVLLLTSLPVLASLLLLGGVSPWQIFGSLLLTAAVGLAAGAWGNLVAFWREKNVSDTRHQCPGNCAFLRCCRIAGSSAFHHRPEWSGPDSDPVESVSRAVGTLSAFDHAGQRTECDCCSTDFSRIDDHAGCPAARDDDRSIAYLESFPNDG